VLLRMSCLQQHLGTPAVAPGVDGIEAHLEPTLPPVLCAGARAAGQTEWRWVAGHLRLPFFPHDHPDTPASAHLAATLRSEQAVEVARRPKGRAPRLSQVNSKWLCCVRRVRGV
jgi:hypothetical protein